MQVIKLVALVALVALAAFDAVFIHTVYVMARAVPASWQGLL